MNYIETERLILQPFTEKRK